MHDVLFRYIENKSAMPLSKDGMDLLERVFTPKKFRKRQYFLQPGDVCTHGGFIAKGAMRQYSLDEKGNEHIVELMLEDWWIGDRVSMVSGEPSCFYIDAWEDTDALLVAVKNFDLMRTIPAVKKVGEMLSDRHLAALHKRIHDTLTYTIEQRYEILQQMYPEFIQRFPQHIIASYLGVRKETLSRMRCNVKRN